MPLKDRDAILAELLEIEAVLQSRKHDHDVQLCAFDTRRPWLVGQMRASRGPAAAFFHHAGI
jgi:hypothetical protein